MFIFQRPIRRLQSRKNSYVKISLPFFASATQTYISGSEKNVIVIYDQKYPIGEKYGKNP